MNADNRTPGEKLFDALMAELHAQPTPKSESNDRAISRETGLAAGENFSNQTKKRTPEEVSRDEAKRAEMDEIDEMFEPCVDPWGDCYGLPQGCCRCNQEDFE